jgi:hypothetical protein
MPPTRELFGYESIPSIFGTEAFVGSNSRFGQHFVDLVHNHSDTILGIASRCHSIVAEHPAGLP